jgi:hypothetical protein
VSILSRYGQQAHEPGLTMSLHLSVLRCNMFSFLEMNKRHKAPESLNMSFVGEAIRARDQSPRLL